MEIIETLKINIINRLTGEPYGDTPNNFSLHIGSEVEDLKSDILINLANKGYEDLTTHEYRAMNVPDNHTLTNYKSGIDYAFMNDKYLQLLALYNVILMSKGNIRSLKGIINWFGYDSSKVLKVVRKWNPLINNFWSEDYDLGVMRSTEKYFETSLDSLSDNSDKRNSFETFGTTNLYNIVLEDKDLENGNNFFLDKTYRWRVYLLSLFLESHFLPIHIGIDNTSVRSDFKEESEKIEDGLTRVLNISNHYYSNVNSFFNKPDSNNKNNNIPNLSIDKSKNPKGENGNGNNNDKEEDLNKKPSDSIIDKYKKPNKDKNNSNNQNFILNIPISDINYHLVYFDNKNSDLQVSPDKILKKYLNYYFSGGLIGTPLNLSNNNNLSNNIRSIQFYTEDYSENITNIYSFFDPNKNYLFINHRTKYIHITLDSGLTFEYITNFPSKENISYKLLSNHIQVKYSDGIIDRTSDKYKQITIKQTIDKFIEVFGFDFKKYVNSKTKYTYFKNIPDKYLIDIYKSNNDFLLSKPDDKLMDIYNDTSKIFSVAHLNWFDKPDNISKNNTLILIYFKNFLHSSNKNDNYLKYQIQNLIFPNKENNKNSIYTTGIILYQPGIYDITLTGIIDGILLIINIHSKYGTYKSQY